MKKNAYILAAAALIFFSCKLGMDTDKGKINDTNLSNENGRKEFIIKTLSGTNNFDDKIINDAGGKIESVMEFDGYAYRLISSTESGFEQKLKSMEGVAYVSQNKKVPLPLYENLGKPETPGLTLLSLDGNIKKDPAGNMHEYALRITKARNFYDETGTLQDGAFKAVGYGNNETVVAIIDTGINMNHADFKDLSGKSIILYAKSALSEHIDSSIGDFKPIDGRFRELSIPSNEDGGGHGTHCSGSICAVGDNDKGICGVAWKNTKLISYKGLGIRAGTIWGIYASLGDLADIVSILRKAPAERTEAEKGRIPSSVPSGYQITQKTVPVNMSLGGLQFSLFEYEMINKAISCGVLPVVAMGNDGRTIAAFPASIYGVLSVGATTAQDKKANFSDSGSWISICAPGHNIISCYNGDWKTNSPVNDQEGEVNFNGTSMATPYITGTIGYLLSFDQARNLTPYQIKTVLERTADKIDAANPWYGYDSNGFSKYYGYGRVNVLEAAKCITGQGKPIPKAGEVYSEYAVRVKTPYNRKNAKIFIYEDVTNVCIAVGLTSNDGYAVFRGLKKGQKYTAKAYISSTSYEASFTAPENADIECKL